MQVLYKSTRGKEQAVTASMAILKGLSEDGGLFVPEQHSTAGCTNGQAGTDDLPGDSI